MDLLEGSSLPPSYDSTDLNKTYWIMVTCPENQALPCSFWNGEAPRFRNNLGEGEAATKSDWLSFLTALGSGRAWREGVMVKGNKEMWGFSHFRARERTAEGCGHLRWAVPKGSCLSPVRKGMWQEVKECIPCWNVWGMKLPCEVQSGNSSMERHFS